MPKFAANLSMMFTELPFMDRFAAAADAGFRGVEYLFPYDNEPELIREQLDRHQLTQVLFNCPVGDWDAGDRGLAIFPALGKEFRDSIALAKRYAVALGCKQVHCLAGLVPVTADHRRLRTTYVDNLRYAADLLGADDIDVLIEPINTRDMPGYFLDTSAKAADIIESVDADNLFLQFDVYHMQIMEGDLAPTLAKRFDMIRHIQIADTPGRHEPGSGEINFAFLFDYIDQLGFDGWIGCEYRPRTTTAESLHWMPAAQNSV